MAVINPDDPFNKQARKGTIIAGVKKSDGLVYPFRIGPSGGIVTDTALPSSTNGKSLTLTGSADQLPALATKAGLTIEADEDNVDDVWVGGSDVAVNNGFRLSPGESVPVVSDNQDTVYVIGTATEKVHYLSG